MTTMTTSLALRAAAAASIFWSHALVVRGLTPHESSSTVTRAKFLSSTASLSFLGVGTVQLAFPEATCASNLRNAGRDMEMNVAKDNPRKRGFLGRYTGDSTPFTFPVSPVSLVKEWPDEAPFASSDFSRMDPTNDNLFYSVPRPIYHIDEPAVASLTQFYRNNIPAGSDILDICSSWVSHYPLEFLHTMHKIAATGINPLELRLNDQLTGGFVAADLNSKPELPYPDNSFDVVTCVVSIDYLIEPIKVLQEVHRVLRPGGKMIVSQSNRCFPTKAIAMWLKMNDRQHLELINAYFQYAGGFAQRQAYDITAALPDPRAYRDPMFVVVAVKSA